MIGKRVEKGNTIEATSKTEGKSQHKDPVSGGMGQRLARVCVEGHGHTRIHRPFWLVAARSTPGRPPDERRSARTGSGVLFNKVSSEGAYGKSFPWGACVWRQTLCLVWQIPLPGVKPVHSCFAAQSLLEC